MVGHLNLTDQSPLPPKKKKTGLGPLQVYNLYELSNSVLSAFLTFYL